MFGVLALGLLQLTDSVGNQSYQWSLSLSTYPVAMCIFLAVFYKKYKAQKFGLVLMLSLIATYLITELHELPAFIKMYFGLWDNIEALPQYFVWYTPLNHLYTVIIGAFGLKVGHVKLKTFVPLFMTGAIATAIMYEWTQHGVYSIWIDLTRLVWIPVFCAIFYYGDKHGQALN